VDEDQLFELRSVDGQPGSYAGPQVCDRTNGISLTPQKHRLETVLLIGDLRAVMTLVMQRLCFTSLYFASICIVVELR
jgi:hypothetical protein